MTDIKAYDIITINGTPYHVAPNLAAIVEAVVSDDRCNLMASIAFDWLHLHAEQNQPGGKPTEKHRVEVIGGCRG